MRRIRGPAGSLGEARHREGRGRLPQAMSDSENRCAQRTVCGANLVGAAFRQPRAIPYSQFKTESMASRNVCTSSAVV